MGAGKLSHFVTRISNDRCVVIDYGSWSKFFIIKSEDGSDFEEEYVKHMDRLAQENQQIKEARLKEMVVSSPKDKIVDFKTFIRSMPLVELFNESICNILDEYEKLYGHEQQFIITLFVDWTRYKQTLMVFDMIVRNTKVNHLDLVLAMELTFLTIAKKGLLVKKREK